MNLTALPRYSALIKATSASYRLDPSLVGAIALQESDLDPNAYNGADPQGGAFGLMQILLGTARGLGYQGDAGALFQPALNLELGAKLLRQNLDRVQRYTPALSQLEAENRAIAAYNAGWSKERPGDAPRTSSGRFVNQAYVDRVRAFQAFLGSLKPAAIGAGVLALVAAAVLLVSSSGRSHPDRSTT